MKNKSSAKLQTFSFKKRRKAEYKNKKQRQWRATGTKIGVYTVSASITDRKNAETGFKITSPARTTEEENTGPSNTLIKKRPKDTLMDQRHKDLSHQSRHSKTTLHH